MLPFNYIFGSLATDTDAFWAFPFWLTTIITNIYNRIRLCMHSNIWTYCSLSKTHGVWIEKEMQKGRKTNFHHCKKFCYRLFTEDRWIRWVMKDYLLEKQNLISLYSLCATELRSFCRFNYITMFFFHSFVWYIKQVELFYCYSHKLVKKF